MDDVPTDESAARAEPLILHGRSIVVRDWRLDDLPHFARWSEPGQAWQGLDGPYFTSVALGEVADFHFQGGAGQPIVLLGHGGTTHKKVEQLTKELNIQVNLRSHCLFDVL